MTIGEHIKQERKKRGWTQAKLAKKAPCQILFIQIRLGCVINVERLC